MNLKTKRELRSLILDYLKKKLPNFKKQGKMFTCPKCGSPNELSCNVFPEGSGKLYCFEPTCKFKGGIFDVARLLEYDGEITNEEIAEFLKEEFGVTTNDDVEKLLKKYEGWKWDLVPIAHGAKNPIEKSWTEKSHKNLQEWQTWLQSGLGLGCKTGQLSNITVIDIDKEDVPQLMQTLFEPTLVQRTKHGVHWIYIYEEEIPTGNFEIDGVHIDVQNNGRQIVIEPSIVDNYERKMSKNKTISKMNLEMKEFLINHLNKKEIKEVKEIDSSDPGIITGLEGHCNNTFAKVLGQFRKFMPMSSVERCAYTINYEMLDDPMDKKVIRGLCQSLERYHNADIQEISEKIIEHLKIVEEAHVRDLRECLNYDRKDLEQALRYLCDHKKIYKIKKDLYRLIEDVEWRTDFVSLSKPLDFIIPYFDKYATFNNGSLIVIGAKTGTGKTHLAVNFLEGFIKQDICPKIITTEADSGIGEIACARGLKEGDFKFWQASNPLTVPFYENEVRIIDWLKAPKGEHNKTDVIYEELANRLVNYGGILIVFAQLKKESGNFYAEDMVEQFSSLVAKFLYPMKNGVIDNLNPYFDIQKARRTKLNRQYFQIPLSYNNQIKEVKLK